MMNNDPSKYDLMSTMATRKRSMEVLRQTIVIHEDAIKQLKSRLIQLQALQDLDEFLLKELYNGNNE